ncbi:hypothetical protein Ccrd_017308 [Cynara cardunculus var. scolymus]|uniref:Uncharacterized protein n=1 Tax=Cynara cardunculus var. scolymus TaxID=59895 RepID=A0A118K2H5_CYNCS|nr:hypothetical protein Ccrd_017308 [Cynara cardunculus var. scolymus]
MEGFISLLQHQDNKENIPPFSKTHDNKLSPKMTLKKKKKTNYRKPLNDITNLLLYSPIHPPETSPSFPRLQSAAICRSKAAETLSNHVICDTIISVSHQFVSRLMLRISLTLQASSFAQHLLPIVSLFN